MARRPPHMLVTTPESLYILLTSDGGRGMLSTVRTVIVDEIHALVRDKRGSHLALSLERLEAPRGGPSSASGSPPRRSRSRRSARFLVGAGRDCRARRRGALPEPRPRDRGPAVAARRRCARTSSGTRSTPAIAELVREHRTTLVFVNTRKLAERIAGAARASASARTPSRATTAASRASGGSTPSSVSRRASCARSSRRRRSSWASTSATWTSSSRSAPRGRSRRSCSASAAPATRSAGSRRGGSSR